MRKQVGSGGMGEVYLAEDTKLRRRVALKRLTARLRTDPNYRRFLLEEARRASSFNDPRIAGIYDVIDHNDELFVVMEYVDGFTLRERLDKPISIEEFTTIAMQCVEGLRSAHQNGIVHGDLKPENVMIMRLTGDIKICDFGLAQRIPEPDHGMNTTTQPNVAAGLRGTPAYIA